jgi:acyl homoserine lactone synthase
LPTTGPTLLREAFADALPDAAGLVSPAIWECTRLCVDDRSSADQLTRTCGILVAALGDIGLSAGIESYVGNFDASMFRVYRRVGCEVEVLGHTDKYGRRVYVGRFPVSAEILAGVKARLGPIHGALTWAPGGWRPSQRQVFPFPASGQRVA